MAPNPDGAVYPDGQELLPAGTLTLFGKPEVGVVMVQLRAPWGFAVLGPLISFRLSKLKNSARISRDFFSPNPNLRPTLMDSAGRRWPLKSL